MINFHAKQIGNDICAITLCKKFYDREAILRAAYQYSEKMVFKLDNVDDMYVNVILKLKSNLKDEDRVKLFDAFYNEIGDQQLRLDLEARFGSIRQAIYERAFSLVNVK